MERPLTSSLDNSSRVYPFRNSQIAKFFSEIFLNTIGVMEPFKGLSFTLMIDRKYLGISKHMSGAAIAVALFVFWGLVSFINSK